MLILPSYPNKSVMKPVLVINEFLSRQPIILRILVNIDYVEKLNSAYKLASWYAIFLS